MHPAPSRPKRTLFRLGAVGLGLGVVLVAELVLSLLGVGTRHRAPRHDIRVADYYPYRQVSFPAQQIDGATLCGPHPGNIGVMRAGLFPCSKPEGTFRIFVLGGSSVMGWEIDSDEQVFSEVMANALRARRTPVEVINGGVSTWNSFQLLPLVDEALALGADLIVLYAGHNDYGYFKAFDAYLEAPPAWVWLQSRTRDLALYQAGLLVLARLRPDTFPEQTVTDEVFDREGWGRSDDGTLIARDGYREHHRMVPWEPPPIPADLAEQKALYRRLRNEQELVDRRFRENVSLMAARIDAAGARFAITEVVSNLFVRPLCSVDWVALDADERARLDALQGIVDDDRRSLEERAAAAEEALRLVPHNALLQFVAGELAFNQEDHPGAIERFTEARDDMPVCFSRRAPSRHNRTVADLASALGAGFISLSEAVNAAAEIPGLPATRLFRDNLHLSAQGHRVVGEAIADGLAAENLLPQ